ncbi:hypothetical protein VE01_00058 [Pseudogymnoascus verrucosus]|uniref:Copper-containing nitrite reductase n=1 Tax=Pseudogymnoascus verrucosus TaxID=342668 RepID=A0A2P2SX51_9PEZI|nr:uncharacterized protein VE01_00058 [Pseudogymnoascus verrucosus]OBU01424.1 hypothetical protein VE01_00058 [Pseudogymnoascus verrucosus]
MSYFRAPVSASWRAASSQRQNFMLSNRALISSPLLLRGAGSISSRGVATTTTAANTSRFGKRARIILIAVSASVSIGLSMYTGGKDTTRSSLVSSDKNPNTAVSAVSGKQATRQNDGKQKPVMTLEPVSSQPSISFVRPGEVTDEHLKIYDAIEDGDLDISKLPRENAVLTAAPFVPPPITRDYPVLLQVPMVTTTKETQLTSQFKYEQWTFNDMVPGPFIRARVGDVVELSLTNKDESGNPHNIDCHAFTGPGGGAALTTAEENQTKTANFKLLTPGIYLYHCAAAPVPVHIANGMYGLIYVQPAEGDLPPVDREYYVMQSEFYYEPPEVLENGRKSDTVEFSYPNAMREEPDIVVFNGRESAMTRDAPLKAEVGESVRIFFGNAGPNLTSSFHVIGGNFRKVYRDGDVLSPPANFVQTISVPPGSASIVDMKMAVPGTYALVDHAIFRLDKGAVGYLNVSGQQKTEITTSKEHAEPCVGCKLHP